MENQTKAKIADKKLTLHKETIRDLTLGKANAGAVRGGVYPGGRCSAKDNGCN